MLKTDTRKFWDRKSTRGCFFNAEFGIRNSELSALLTSFASVGSSFSLIFFISSGPLILSKIIL